MNDRHAAPTGAILAGGRALRFGGLPKGLEMVDGARIVDRVAAALGAVTGELLLVGAPDAVAATLPQCRAVADDAPGLGPLGAIITVLRAARGDVLVVAWDMPFVTAGILSPLLDEPDDADAVLWENDGYLEPLCGLYRATALGGLTAAFSAGDRGPREALRRLQVRVLAHASGDERSPFTSINTPDQLDAARQPRARATR